jgi:hypothetical protein
MIFEFVCIWRAFNFFQSWVILGCFVVWS